MGRTGQVKRFFFVEGDGNTVKFLNQSITRLILRVIWVLTVCRRLSLLSRYPLPYLRGLSIINEDD